MMLDTNGDIFSEGRFSFRVSAIPEEIDIKGYKAWQWTFDAETEDGIQTYNERFMVWLLAPLLRGLGFQEVTPGKFNFEPTEALDRTVVATIKHVVLDKGPSAGKTVARMTDIGPVAKMSSPNRAAMAAQAPAEKSVDDIPF